MYNVTALNQGLHPTLGYKKADKSLFLNGFSNFKIPLKAIYPTLGCKNHIKCLICEWIFVLTLKCSLKAGTVNYIFVLVKCKTRKELNVWETKPAENSHP